MDPQLAKALAATSETTDVEFKAQMDTESKRDWAEITKDFVAISNSGGGVIVFGLDNDGKPSGCDISRVSEIDPATITDKVYSFTWCQFADFRKIHASKDGSPVVAFIIDSTPIPLVFTQSGSYQNENGRIRYAFRVGQVYFRHGAKSEPGMQDDLRHTVERRLQEIRTEWLSNIRRVVTAPEGAQLYMLDSEVRQSDSPQAVPIRLVDDPSAPGYRILDPNKTHCYRQTDLMEKLHDLLPKLNFNSYDLLAIRRAYDIEEKPRFFYRPMYGSPQYSDDFVTWMEEQALGDERFFDKARETYRIIRYE